MNAKSITVFAVIALTVFAGAAAAMPGSAPDAAGDEDEMPGGTPADDAAAANASAETGDDDSAADAAAQADDARDRAENPSEHGPAAAGAEHPKGPAVDLPEQVPDHVSQIHEQIRQFLSGDSDGSLGERISALVGDDRDADDGDVNDAGEDGSANASTDASANATAAA